MIGILCAGLVLAQQPWGFGENDVDAVDVPLATILADASAYQGQHVRTQGFATLGFETTGLYLRRDSWARGALWLDIAIPDVTLQDLQPLDDVIVTVEGRVNVNNKGHRGMYSAALENVNVIQYRNSEYGQSELVGVTQTSLIALLGSPRDWDEKAVSVSGFMHSEIHGVSLYATSEHCERGMYQYSVDVVLDEMRPATDWTDLPVERNCYFAMLEGVFVSTPVRPVSPDVFVIGLERPGIIYAHWMRVE